MKTLNFLEADHLNFSGRTFVANQADEDKELAQRIKIDASQLADLSDRTLTLGDNRDKTRVHTFLKGGVIYVHVYADMGGAVATISHSSGDTVHSDQVIPEIRSIPTATDREFAELMLNKRAPLKFYHFNIPASFVELNKEGYFGAIDSTIS